MRALILETGRARGALAAARALHGAGWTVGVGTPTGQGMASASRATARRHRIPSPQADLDAFTDAVGEAVRGGGYKVVFGAGDAELTALSLRREEFEAVVPYAAHERVMRSVDKLALAEAAAAAGLPIPRTAEATAAQLEGQRPPFVVKAALHAPLSHGGAGRLEVLIARDRASAASHAAAIRAAGGVPLVQELVSGRLMACAVVATRESRIVIGTAQVADACWPPDVGVSARARTVEPDPGLFEGISRLLARLGWFGLAQLQFILPSEGAPLLIDFNGRFYGSLALAVGAGANLPATWAALATGRTPPPSPPGGARVGVRYQWLEGDLRRARAERRGGLLRDLSDSLRYSRGAVHATWAPRDPWPSVHQLARLPLRLAGRVRS